MTGRLTPLALGLALAVAAIGVAAQDAAPIRNSIGMRFVKIPAGSFRMGSTVRPAEQPVHTVSLREFWMGVTEVTQAQWQAVMGYNPSHFKKSGPDAPVEMVTWNDAQTFIRKLNTLEPHWRYRLPSEAEWEYACRAGGTAEAYGPVEAIAWMAENSGGTTHPVGLKKPNAFGLYDMLGNVPEWCQDTWHPDYHGAPVDGSAWEGGDSPVPPASRGRPGSSGILRARRPAGPVRPDSPAGIPRRACPRGAEVGAGLNPPRVAHPPAAAARVRRCRLPRMRRLTSIVAIACLGMAASAGAQRSVYHDLLDRASAYAAQYEKALSAIVAEEEYVQRVVVPRAAPPGTGPRSTAAETRDAPAGQAAGLVQRFNAGQTPAGPNDQTRHMLSDVLMVQLSDRVWLGFRDVIEVDGHRVRHREDRLRELFLKSSATHRAVTDESARYNIGTIERTLNVPTFALQFLHPELIGRFSYWPDHEEAIGDRMAVVFSYTETARPTMVRTGDRKAEPVDDLPSTGRMWIDRQTGEVLRTELVLADPKQRVQGVVTVTYARSEPLGQLVPAEMHERYAEPTRPMAPVIECTATYSNFRRFTVQTDEKIQVPKGP